MTGTAEIILHHDVAGDPDGPPVILIHALGGDRTFWAPAVRHLNPRWRVVMPDLRGAGLSPDLDAPLLLDRTADDIEALRKHLGFDRAAVAGCAIGAMAGVRYAAKYPDAVRALVLANPGYRIVPDAVRNLSERADTVRAGGMKALLPDAVANAFVGHEGSPEMLRYTERFLKLGPENYALSALGGAQGDISEDLSRLRCPVLLMPGRNDRLFPIAVHTDPIAAALPDARLIEVEDGAHFVPVQVPRTFAAELDAFLRDSV